MTGQRGRKPDGETAMTPAERKRRSRKAQSEAAQLATKREAAKPPKAARRPRSDSASSAVRAMFNASKDYPPPPIHTPLTDTAIPFWNAIMAARAVDDWIPADLISAANLAQCQADFIDENALLRFEGRVIENTFGNVVINPRAKVVEDLTRRGMSLMRTLRMGGKAAGDPRDLTGSRNLEAESRSIRSEIEDEEGLLA